MAIEESDIGLVISQRKSTRTYRFVFTSPLSSALLRCMMGIAEPHTDWAGTAERQLAINASFN